jgi:hypothetical protein
MPSDHDDVLGSFDAVAGERLGDTGRGVLQHPVEDFQKLLAHHAIILTSEGHALFDFRAVDLNEHLALDLVGEFFDVPLVELAMKRLDTFSTSTPWDIRGWIDSLVADKPLERFFNRLDEKISHEYSGRLCSY